MQNFRPPFDGAQKVTSLFGTRMLNGARDNHIGTDFVAQEDDTVRACCAGRVSFAGWLDDKAKYGSNGFWTFGYHVQIVPDDKSLGALVIEAHMQKGLLVTAGQHVAMGQPLGKMGNTGNSFGAHTHVSLKQNGRWVNPLPLMGWPNACGTYRYADEKESIAAAAFRPYEAEVTAVLNVRTGPGTSCRRKAKAELTADGQAHATAAGCLVPGTRITVQQAENGWGRCPSGWVCLTYTKEV